MAGQVYLFIAIIALGLIAAALIVTGRSNAGPAISPLTGLALALIVVANLFDDNRWIAYGFIGAGVIVAVVDILRRRRD